MSNNKNIRSIFSEVAHTYELVNLILTFGLDVVWQKRAEKIAMQEEGNRMLFGIIAIHKAVKLSPCNKPNRSKRK